MKKIFLILSATAFFIVSCKAQQPLPKLTTSQVKTANMVYHIQKPSDKLTKVINSNNKLSNTKPVAPMFKPDMMVPDYINFDK